jgi:hypothetical protein
MNQTTSNIPSPLIIHLNVFRSIQGNSSAITNRSNIIQVGSTRMWVLEMEDVLFHFESALMMPENPTDRSSKGGTTSTGNNTPESDDQDAQLAVSGVQAMALAYRQLEFDSSKKVVIAAHADTSGNAQFNFDLSADRGKNIYSLLIGDKQCWLDSIAADNRHKIEDYQQVLTWASTRFAWGCDPQGIDDQWGPKTETAVQTFLNRASSDRLLVRPVEEVFQEIRNHARKRWSRDALSIIYDLYDRTLWGTLSETEAGMTAFRSQLKSSLLNSDVPCSSCGESFPIDSAQKENYRSQKNRRVEILFFDNGEVAPEKIQQCNSKVGYIKDSNDLNAYREQCPIWPFRNYLIPLYINPNDLNAVVYHVCFVYFDCILNRLTNIPQGLSFKAFENGFSSRGH